jgi:CheY-like chemotaxis protein
MDIVLRVIGIQGSLWTRPGRFGSYDAPCTSAREIGGEHPWRLQDRSSTVEAVTYRVLLCDDTPAYRTLTRAVLEPQGAEIVGEAGDGEECLELLGRQVDPDLILLDVNMPGMDGLTALPAIRRSAPRADVVMLSTGAAADLEAESLRRGARAFLHKPQDIHALPGLLRAAMS